MGGQFLSVMGDQLLQVMGDQILEGSPCRFWVNGVELNPNEPDHGCNFG